MSRLLVVTRPTLAVGFHLAGVEAFAAEDAKQAQALIAKWLEAGEAGLLAIDDELLADFDLAFRRKLWATEQLPHLGLPSGEPGGWQGERRRRIAEMIRRAIGFHITFKGESTQHE